jgi:hypothetical protein
LLDEGQAFEAAQRLVGRRQRQPPGEGLAALQPRGLFIGGEWRADIWAHWLMRRAADVQLLAGLEAAIDQAALAQALDGPLVVGQVLGLPADRCLPLQSQPGQIFEDRRVVFRSAAGGVDVLDPQQEPAAGLARRLKAVRAERRGRDADSPSAMARTG